MGGRVGRVSLRVPADTRDSSADVSLSRDPSRTHPRSEFRLFDVDDNTTLVESRLHFRVTCSGIDRVFTTHRSSRSNNQSGSPSSGIHLFSPKNSHLGKINRNGLTASSAAVDLTEPLKLGLSHDSSL